MIALEQYSKIEGVSEACRHIGISPDGQFLAVSMVSRPEIVRLCNLQGKVFQNLEGHSGIIHSIDFSPDGRTIASASSDKTVRVWSPTGELLSLFDRFDSGVDTVSFAPQVSILAAGEESGLIVMFDIGGNYIATLHSPKGRIYSLSWASNNNYLTAACADSNLYLYDIGNQMKKIYPHPGPVFGAAFSPVNGNQLESLLLISACSDGNIRLINIDNENRNEINVHSKMAASVAYSPNDSLIASTSFDKSVKLIDRHGNLRGEYLLESEGLGINFSRDGKRLYVICNNQCLYIFNVSSK